MTEVNEDVSGRFSDFRQVISNPYAAKILEYITNNNPIFYRQKLTRATGLNIDTINRWLKIIHAMGSGFVVNIDPEKIGLWQVALKFSSALRDSPTQKVAGLRERSKWFIRWKGNGVFPEARTLLVSFAPLSSIGVNTILRDYQEVGDIEDYFLADTYIPNKLSREFFRCDYGYKICMNDWKSISAHLKRLVARYLDDHASKQASIKKRGVRKRRIKIDLLDLLMISHFEENALYRPQELARKTKSTVLKINRHLRKHILYPQLINGTRIRYGRIMGRTMVIYSVWGKSHPSVTFGALSEISKIYGFISGVASSSDGKFMFILGVPGHEVFEYAEYMPDTFKEVFDEVEIYQIDKFSIRSFTIPYIPYDRFNKEWSVSEEVIVETKENLMKKGLL